MARLARKFRRLTGFWPCVVALMLTCSCLLATVLTDGGGLGYAAYHIATGSGSPLALGLLLLAAVTLATVLER